jgi:hypothetical protein
MLLSSIDAAETAAARHPRSTDHDETKDVGFICVFVCLFVVVVAAAVGFEIKIKIAQ